MAQIEKNEYGNISPPRAKGEQPMWGAENTRGMGKGMVTSMAETTRESNSCKQVKRHHGAPRNSGDGKHGI